MILDAGDVERAMRFILKINFYSEAQKLRIVIHIKPSRKMGNKNFNNDHLSIVTFSNNAKMLGFIFVNFVFTLHASLFER